MHTLEMNTQSLHYWGVVSTRGGRQVANSADRPRAFQPAPPDKEPTLSTEQTFTATTAGRIWADVISNVGTVDVTVDPHLEHAEITVRTNSDEGPIADAVRSTTVREHVSNGLNVFEVRVPKADGGGTTMQIGGSHFSFSGNSGVSIGGGNFGVINTGEMTGAVISGGDIWVGGRQVVSDGRVVAEQGTVVGGPGVGTIAIEVKVPTLSSVRLETTSADLRVLRGDLQFLDVRSISGDVEAKGVHTLRGNTTSGDFEVESIDARVDVNSVSGDLEIGAYNGSDFRASTVSGDISVTATPAATGSIDASTVSGNVTTRNVAQLHERVSTISGRHRRR